MAKAIRGAGRRVAAWPDFQGGLFVAGPAAFSRPIAVSTFGGVQYARCNTLTTLKTPSTSHSIPFPTLTATGGPVETPTAHRFVFVRMPYPVACARDVAKRPLQKVTCRSQCRVPHSCPLIPWPFFLSSHRRSSCPIWPHETGIPRYRRTKPFRPLTRLAC